ncbi:transposase-like protein [Bibersteinia trehalosi USDA-ARS-USMARC-188]|uniref:Transposase-like protein n=1 Tax=Bibersteinia trehalosi USDA-ARS-USMARC-188 TaxID=1263829 RepID=A0A4V7IAS9_BIBTR|nr:transposase-like protein [Bibersteinia trehalosi USDA-ARS-USMARC-188]
MQELNQAKCGKAGLVKALRMPISFGNFVIAYRLKRSTFFYHLAEKSDKNAEIEQKIAEIYHEHRGNYGYHRITFVLKKIWTINHKKVQAIMPKLRLKGKCKRRKYRSYQGEVGKITANLLKQHFFATQPNEKWVTGVTEFKCAEGKHYLSPIKGLFNGEIIAYDLAESPNFEQVTRVMNQAIARLNGEKPMLHSAQGWQYQMPGFQAICKQNGIIQSMSRKGNCLDNGAMESFFGRLKTECYFDKRFETLAELKQTIHDYIHYYNNERIQVKLKGLSPVAYRTQSLN